MAHVLLLSPTSNLPTILNEQSMEAAQLFQMGYTPIATGYRKELERLEEELMQEFVQELEYNSEN